MQPNYPTPTDDPFIDPRGGVGEPGPTMSELAGRTIAVVVKSYDPTATYQAPGDKELKSRPCVIGDLYVLDGGPLNYGGSDSSTDPKPPTHTVAIPAKFENRYFAQINVVSALRDAAPVILDAQGVPSRGQGVGGPVVGLVERSTIGGKPWNLVKLNVADPERGASFAALRGNAARVYMAGQSNPDMWRTHMQHGVPIQAAQAAQAAPYAWPAGAATAPVSPAAMDPAYAAFLAQQAAAQAPPAPAIDPAYAAFLAQQQAAQQAPPPPPVYVPPAPPVDPAYAAWQAQQAAQAASIPAAPAGLIPQQAPPAAIEQDIPPTGYEAIWQTMTPESKAAIRAAVAQQHAATTQGRPNPF